MRRRDSLPFSLSNVSTCVYAVVCFLLSLLNIYDEWICLPTRYIQLFVEKTVIADFSNFCKFYKTMARRF